MMEKKQVYILRKDAGPEEREQTFSQCRYYKSTLVTDVYSKVWIWLFLCISLPISILPVNQGTFFHPSPEQKQIQEHR